MLLGALCGEGHVCTVCAHEGMKPTCELLQGRVRTPKPNGVPSSAIPCLSQDFLHIVTFYLS